LSWKERIEKLPVEIGGLEIQVIRENFRGAVIVASHSYVPYLGTTYQVTLYENIADRLQLEKELITELGQPLITDKRDSNCWHYVWQSSSKEIPETEFHLCMGRERITAICREHGLENDKDLKVIDEILVACCIFHGHSVERMKFIAREIREFDEAHQEVFITTISHIIQECCVPEPNA